ncbi:TonB-dependent receptor [Sphingomonas sp. OK281]|uniref:TonB-dependent receptor domain-containing protein n=1 Tax=Sphingomonas sp. OK281 TaxID=1881067 RepID=UPI0008E1E778|nr:TonB-dependent receptor [Sphingomonas sp. OK281]SFO27694.1 TonB-dependent Receptor Plug Domain [Sphingomonas sp. OK281]
MRHSYLARASALALLAAGYAASADAQVTTTPQCAPGEERLADGSRCTPVSGEPALGADGASRAESADGEITVTGSRVRLPNIEGTVPVTVIGNQYLSNRGLTNAADALNEIPGIRGSITPAGAQGSFGQGVNFINALNLGSNRTLTLINGRRAVSSNVNTIFNQGSAGTQVDVNVIPTLLLDHTEIISTVGATTYGSDAIAATVNYVLDTRLKGIRYSATSGVTEEGDAFRYNAAIAGGVDFDEGRGNITLAYTRDYQKGLLYNSRDFLRDNVGSADNPTTAQAAALGRPAGTTAANDGRINTAIGFNNSATDGIPGSILVRDRTLPLLTGGGLITSAFSNVNGTGAVAGAVQNYQFDRSGNLVPFNRGIRFLSVQQASGGDGFRFNDYSQITSDLRRNVFNGFAGYDFSDAFKVFVEATYFQSRGDELVQQPTFNSSLFGGLSGALTFTTASPFLTNQARAQLTALGVQRFQVSRASLDLADLTGFSTNKQYRAVAGARGDFKIGGRSFNYEVSSNVGRVDIRDTRQDINAQRFINAVNVTRNAAGQIVCTATPAVQAAPGGTPIADASCVPLNLLGEGLSSPEARAYIISQNVTNSRLEQIVYNANIGGQPFELFGNEQGFNIGFEHREERGSFTPSTFEQQGLGRSVAILPVAGRYNVDEVFGEVILPIVAPRNGLSFLSSLQLNASGRHVDNTVNGGFTAYAGGISIAPIRDIMFRGNYTKSFRAPAITELFSPVANVFTTVPDLCSPANINAGAAPANRARNCAAFLTSFPNATPLDAAAATVPGRNGGNITLQNEVAKSFTYGVVLQPRFIPGLSLTVDYVNIKISNPIASLTVAQIASACFDNATFNAADPANGNAFCSQIRRYAQGSAGTAANGRGIGGQVINDPANPGVSSGFVNGNRVKFEGIQSELVYNRPLTGLNLPGSIAMRANLFVALERVNDITGVAPVRTDGTLGDPTFQGQVNIGYIHEDFGITSSFNYIGEQLFSRVSRGPDIREIDKLNDFVTINPSVYVNASDRFRITFAVTNLLNRVGQKYNGIIIPASYSDLIGRRFAVSVNGKF